MASLRYPCPFPSSQENSSCQVLLWLLTVLALSVLIVLAAWLASLPKNPTSTISALSVPIMRLQNGPSMAAGGGEDSNDTISYVLEIKNPNIDSGIYYDDITVTIFAGEDRVGESTVSAFYQGKGKTKKVIDSVAADIKVIRDHAGEFLQARAELKVQLQSQIRYKTWGRKTKHHGLNLLGEVPIGSDGKIRGKKKKIKLRHANKKRRRIKVDQ